MIEIKDIKAPVKSEMDVFEKNFKASMKSSVPLLDTITKFIIKRKGKQLRPLFVFLSAKTIGEITDATHTSGTLIELLHTATLVHDDVVDDSVKRRGFFSINALWKNKVAVLIGDFLLSKGLLVALDKDEFGLLKIVSNAVRAMSEGELLQIEKARKLDITEDIYFSIIEKKTASLIATCCECGASSAKATPEQQEKMRQFGKYAGIAFQIKDDLFDYKSSKKIGKPTGIDIKEKKMTLPLIHALNNSNKSEKRRIINIIKNHNTNKVKVQEVIDFVIDKGGIEYAKNKMNEYHAKAFEILDDFEDNDAKKSLQMLVDYTIQRNK